MNNLKELYFLLDTFLNAHNIEYSKFYNIDISHVSGITLQGKFDAKLIMMLQTSGLYEDYTSKRSTINFYEFRPLDHYHKIRIVLEFRNEEES